MRRITILRKQRKEGIMNEIFDDMLRLIDEFEQEANIFIDKMKEYENNENK